MAAAQAKDVFQHRDRERGDTGEIYEDVHVSIGADVAMLPGDVGHPGQQHAAGEHGGVRAAVHGRPGQQGQKPGGHGGTNHQQPHRCHQRHGFIVALGNVADGLDVSRQVQGVLAGGEPPAGQAQQVASRNPTGPSP